jgi:hypothetical protein
VVSKPSTRDMSDKHEDFLAELLGGRKTKGSGSHWRDQMDGKNDQQEQAHALAWDGKATQANSVGVSREMWAKACEQSGGLIPSIAIRFYGAGFRLKPELDLIALEVNDFAAILEDARQAHIRQLESASTTGMLRDVQREERNARHRLMVLLGADAPRLLSWDALLDEVERQLARKAS